MNDKTCAEPEPKFRAGYFKCYQPSVPRAGPELERGAADLLDPREPRRPERTRLPLLSRPPPRKQAHQPFWQGQLHQY